MQWFELQLEVPLDLKDSVVNRLFELGAQGLEEAETPELATLKGYFDDTDIFEVEKEIGAYIDSVADLFPLLPRVKCRRETVKNENWAESYRQFYQAQKLTRLFFLKPAWDTKTEVPEGMIPLVMEPGQAFGTGLHGSTRLCLKLIEHGIDQFPDQSRMRFMDVGTGTGILAMAAFKLGGRHITAIDNDPIAVTTANENFRLNECEGLVASSRDLADFSEPYDLIVSNILLETHRELAPVYQRLLAAGGQLILSGLLAHQHQELMEFMNANGFIVETAEYMQEWMAVLLRRSN